MAEKEKVLEKIVGENDLLKESKEGVPFDEKDRLIVILRKEIATLKEANERLPADSANLIEDLRKEIATLKETTNQGIVSD